MVAQATVINFDDLEGYGSPVNYDLLTATPYAGLTWGTSTDDAVPGHTSVWGTIDETRYWQYSDSHSYPVYVFPAWGGNNLAFTFPEPVTFNGAWFAPPPSDVAGATRVRFWDDQGNRSPWLAVGGPPQYLRADFEGSTTIGIEREGVYSSDPTLGHGLWYTMDDITYNESSPVPEPASCALLALAAGGIGAMVKKRRR